MNPKHSIDYCPICGGGLCGVRICEGPEQAAAATPIKPHGLIVCDECEAIWLEPTTSSAHQYPNACDARCPVCDERLWGDRSRWASQSDIETIGWTGCTNPDLDMLPDEGIA